MSSHLATEWTTTAFDILASPQRRYLLSILHSRTEPPALETLATDIAVSQHGSPVVTTDQARNAHIELIHNHIPRLVEEGLLTDNTTGETRTVALADHPILEVEWVTHFLENPNGGPASDEARVTRTLEALQPARRRTVCTVLARHRDTVAVDDLAAMVVAETDDTRLVDIDESDWKPVVTRLIHNDLPALAAADLVEYDRESETAAIATDAPQWQTDWLAASPLGEVTAMLESAKSRTRTTLAGLNTDSTTEVDTTGAGTCWSIEGAENVISRGHEIADSAEEELFITITDAEMIRQRCLERWRAAADRGVDIYVGSCSPRVRDTIRSAVPEATICEPQFDWLNFPVDQIHHGRVVFADRDQVMLVTVDDTTGEQRVTAITGVGPKNALVMLVREHVGPRLDRLKSHSSDDDNSDGQATPHPL